MLLHRLLTLLFITFICGAKAQDISDSLNAFSIDLLATLNSEKDCPNNLVISPYTVWTLLSIVDEGARNETAKQLEDVLGIPRPPGKPVFRNNFKNMSNIISVKDQGVNLETFNAIFTSHEYKLINDFRDLARKHYSVKVEPIDFTNTKVASDRINKYVAQATKNRITNFIHPGDLTQAEIFITSALYFKGAWMNPFNRSLTKPETFYDEKQNKLGEVNMMYQMGFFPYSRLDWIKGYSVEIPYGNGDKMSMIVILPYKDQTLAGMMENMKQQNFSRIINTLDKAKEDFEGEDVKVYLPRFKVASDLILNTILEKMGITDVFNGEKANLLGMFEHYLHISLLIQRAEIDVNEEGTVASAAAGASIINKIPPPKFVVNRPFLYFIVNKPTKSIVFAGKITVPPLNP